MLRRAIAVAVGFHLVLFLVNLPSFSAEEEVAPPDREVYVMPEVRFKRPPPREQQVPQRMQRRVPMPDETPDGPEPIRLEEPEEFEVEPEVVDTETALEQEFVEEFSSPEREFESEFGTPKNQEEMDPEGELAREIEAEEGSEEAENERELGQTAEEV